MNKEQKNNLIELAHSLGAIVVYDDAFNELVTEKTNPFKDVIIRLGTNHIGIIGINPIRTVRLAVCHAQQEVNVFTDPKLTFKEIQNRFKEDFAGYEPSRIKMTAIELPQLEYANFSDGSIYKKPIKKPRIKQKKRAVRKNKEQGKARRKQRKK